MDENVYITMGALALSFSGNFINAIGLVYQKKGHMRIQNTQKKTSIALLTWRLNRDGHLVGMPPKIPRIGEKDLKNVKEESLIAEFMASNQRSFLSEPQWAFGFGIYLMGSLMHVAALGFGPQALLMPMEGVTLAANAVLAPGCLGEQLSNQGIIGTIVVVFGITVTVIFGPHSSITYTATEMLDMLQNLPFLLWTIAMGGFSLAVFVAMTLAKWQNGRASIVMDGNLDKQHARLICFGCVWMAGVFSSATMLTAKQTMELLETTLMGDNQFTTVIPFVILINFVLMNFLMEYWKQKALATFSALIVVPLFQVSLVVLSTIGGALYFDEFSGMELYRTAFFVLGLVIVCAGIVVLAMSGKKRESPGRTVFSAVLAVMTGKRLLKRARQKAAYRCTSIAALGAGVGQDELDDQREVVAAPEEADDDDEGENEGPTTPILKHTQPLQSQSQPQSLESGLRLDRNEWNPRNLEKVALENPGSPSVQLGELAPIRSPIRDSGMRRIMTADSEEGHVAAPVACLPASRISLPPISMSPQSDASPHHSPSLHPHVPHSNNEALAGLESEQILNPDAEDNC